MGAASFIRSETGAVTVDWVVLAAGIAGLGLATMALVSSGIETLSGETNSALTGISISAAFPAAFEAVQLAASDFTAGLRGAWTGGTVADAGGAIGEVLKVGRGDTAELTLTVPPGASQAVFTFDLIGGDSLDNESATIMINGTPVSVATGNFGSIAWNNVDVPGVTVETQVRSQGTQLGGSYEDGWNDSVTTVSIVVDNAGGDVTLGVLSDTNQALDDEFFGIDNVTAEAR
ncbi:hypothetical protein P6F26_04595 [Roseibacterium sp. SDUM158017]|uniref:hypothetical protein n=1 Tax=Roseicyclus salinarum TaxID=3036773 RepID=UPI002414EFF5|nr:hypothetical protein [Roseibacterium sp. SDUM158017]MDG4647712.1 hypothetical protein [Roseibacterium sp. SDUM158017]